MNKEFYEKYRETKMESGLRYQDFIVDLCYQTIGLVIVQYASGFYQMQVGESRTGVEIKHDEKFEAGSKNLFIETAEKARPRSGDYVPSGIHRNDNAWLYIIGSYDVVFIFAKRLLLALEHRYPNVESNTKTSRGFLMPAWTDGYKYAAIVLEPKAADIIAKGVADLQALGRELYGRVMENPNQLKLFE